MPASKAATALSTVLSNATATDLKAGSTTTDHGVIELSSKTKPTDAAKTLWKHNILGAPVWDEEEKKYIGFFDQRDTVSSVVAASKEASSDDDFTTKMVKVRRLCTWRFGREEAAVLVRAFIATDVGRKQTTRYIFAKQASMCFS